MEILRSVVVFIHLIGFATLFGAWLVEALGQKRITRLMHWGLGIALLAGLVLSAPWGGADLNYMKIGIKVVVLLIIGALLGIGASRARKSGGAVPAGVFWPIGLLTLFNAGLAIIW